MLIIGYTNALYMGTAEAGNLLRWQKTIRFIKHLQLYI